MLSISCFYPGEWVCLMSDLSRLRFFRGDLIDGINTLFWQICKTNGKFSVAGWILRDYPGNAGSLYERNRRFLRAQVIGLGVASPWVSQPVQIEPNGPRVCSSKCNNGTLLHIYGAIFNSHDDCHQMYTKAMFARTVATLSAMIVNHFRLA